MKTVIIDTNGTPYFSADNLKIDIAARRSENRFMVLANNEGDLFNPNEINTNIHQKDRERGGRFWNLQTCSEECYNQFVAFLRSKNRTHYLIAQRRFRNDFR